MEKSELEKKLFSHLKNKEYQSLELYTSEDSWNQLSENESALLSILFISYGEHLLSEGDPKALEKFKIATKISTLALVYHRLGTAYATQHNMRCLKAAGDAFSVALSKDPEYCDCWVEWALLQMRIGNLQGDIQSFIEANQKFQKAEGCLQHLLTITPEEFYWFWGQSLYQTGRLSGEAQEFSQSLDKFHQAAQAGLNNDQFWTDYGIVLSELAVLIGRIELLFESLDLFRQAIKCNPECHEAWVHLGLTCEAIFELSKEDLYYNIAYECYSKATELQPDEPLNWLNWGILHLEYGKCHVNAEQYQLACEKFSKANELDENSPPILTRWAEALVFLGSLTENIELLHEAEAKIIRSLEIQSDHPQAWYTYGFCLNELGRYFEDEAFFNSAIEKFEYALTINPKNAYLWYGLAISNFAMFQYTNDEAFSERTLQCCSRIADLESTLTVPNFLNLWGQALVNHSQLTGDQKFLQMAIDKFEFALGKNETDITKRKLPNELLLCQNYAFALNLMGAHTTQKKYYEKSIYIYTHVLQHQPNNKEVRYGLAMVYSHLANATEQMELFYKSLEHFQSLGEEEREDDELWYDWALTLLHYADLTNDDYQFEQTQHLYDQAEEKLHHAIALGNTDAFYTLGCIHALKGKNSTAMHFIEKAEQAGSLPPIDEVLEDDWLENLQETPEFRAFISQLTSRQENEGN